MTEPKTIDSMLQRLKDEASQGSDLSPGDPVAAWAVAEIERLNAELHKAGVLILEARGYVDHKHRLRADMDNYCLGVPANER